MQARLEHTLQQIRQTQHKIEVDRITLFCANRQFNQNTYAANALRDEYSSRIAQGDETLLQVKAQVEREMRVARRRHELLVERLEASLEYWQYEIVFYEYEYEMLEERRECARWRVLEAL